MIARQPPAWVGEYVGLPFASLGRDRAGCDCWGLVRLVLAEQFGIDLPSYAEDYEDANSGSKVAPLIAAHKDDWQPVDQADACLGDVALLRTKGWPMHVGLIVARGRMLHIEAGINAVIERLDSPIWRQRIVGIFRHPQIDQKKLRCACPSPL